MKTADKIVAIPLFTFLAYISVGIAAANGAFVAQDIVFSWAGLLMIGALIAVSLEILGMG